MGVLKIMVVKKSDQPAELNPDYGNVGECLDSGDCLFVAVHQSAVVRQPASGAFDDPAALEPFKPERIV